MPAMIAPTLFLLLSLAGDPLGGYEREGMPGGSVLYWRGWSEGERARVTRQVPALVERFEELLGYRLQVSFDVVLTLDGPGFRRTVAGLSGRKLESDYVVGVAIPVLHVLVLRGGVPPGSSSFSRTLAHEVAHLLLHDSGARLPRWLDEGMATWLSGHSLDARDEAYLAFLARTGGLYRLSDIEKRFPGGHFETSVAYQQSFLVITYLEEIHGSDAPARAVLEARRGKGTEAILEAVCGQTLEAFDENFRGWLRRRVSLAAALLALLNPWTVCSFLALAAIVRHVFQRRRKLRQLGREEREDDPSPLDEVDPQVEAPRDDPVERESP